MEDNVLEIIGTRPTKINLFPETIAEEIMQNIQLILTTTVGSVSLDRKFGLPIDFIDDPTPRAMMKLSIFALESIQDYEPRVEVKEIEFTPLPEQALDGRLYLKVMVRILDEYTSG